MKKRKNKRRRKIKTQEKIKILVPVIMLWSFIIAAGYFLFCQIWEIPEGALTFSQDGYYEIDSAEDFYLFWDKVCIDDKYACGRLTKDIYLNNISGDMEWEKWKNLHPYEEVEVFSGIFDGNGHTVYGLYSDKGYGLAVRNTGEIRNLSIRESVVYGVRSVGGICSWNWGTIEECGFLGTIDVDGEYFDGKVSGICMENRGEILHCYNLADLNGRSWQPWQPKRFPAITNQGEKQCFAIKDSGWDFQENGQTAALEWQQAAYIPLLIHGNPYGMLVKDKKLGEKQEPQEILNDEVVLDLIMEVIIAKGEKCDDLSMETEVLGDSVFLTLSDGADEIAISVYPAWQEEAGEQEVETSEKFENFEGLWQQCAENLGEKDAESFEHSSWQMVTGQEGEETVFGNFVLFRTDEGRQGFFLQKDQKLYRIECRKNQAKVSEMYEVMLRGLWDGKTSSVGIPWKSEEIREAALAELEEIRVKQEVEAEQTEDLERAVDSEQGNRKKEVWETIPSREELYALETLSIYGVEQINSLEDLTKMPHLKRISINGEISYVNFDLKKGMVPELEALWIRSVQLDNLDFLERFPQLKSLTVCYCGLEDISGIRYQKELTEVNFSNNVIQNIWPLRNCKNLEGISLHDNQVKDISVLASLPELKIIDISFNEFISIEPLQWLENLEGLVCHGNELQNIDALRYLTKLRFLSLLSNQIENFEPITGLTGLYWLDIRDNPGQNIGDLIFVPILMFGNYNFSEEKGRCREAQGILELFYPHEKLTAQDMAKGDLNGDGITDIAVAGLSEESGEKIYIFLGKSNGTFQKITPVNTQGLVYEGTYGDSYNGMLLMEGRLVVQTDRSDIYTGGSYTSIYEYEEGEMREKWKLEVENYGEHKPGFNFWITDIEHQQEKHYMIVEGEWFLLEEENGGIIYDEEEGTFIT